MAAQLGKIGCAMNTFFKTRIRGFTVIELMIVLVIVGILAALGIPAYRDHVIKSYRSTAMGDLQGYAQAMERYYLQHQSYLDDDGNVPQVYSRVSPVDGSAQYDLTTSNVTATTYTITATPKVGSVVEKDGYLQIDQLSRRGWDADNSGGTLADSEWTWNQ